MSVTTKRLAWAVALSFGFPIILVSRITSSNGGWFDVASTVFMSLLHAVIAGVAWSDYLQARRKP